MADITSNIYENGTDRCRSRPEYKQDTGPAEDDLMAIAELLFFAYRDFIGEPDSVLREYGFGRAHHRVLHFVCRHPGMRVADLLDILNITKQSLARVLKQLVDGGLVLQEEGVNDRRERRLHLTKKGLELTDRLSAFQRKRISRALAQSGPDGRSAVRQFLLSMVAEKDQPRVAELIDGDIAPEKWRIREEEKLHD